MKAISAHRTMGLAQKSKCFCTDNSGAKEVEIITVIGHKAKKRMKLAIVDILNSDSDA